MSYGIRIWDRLGQLGTDSTDVVGLCIFAGDIPFTTPTPTGVTITDVDDRPRLVLARSSTTGRLFDATLIVGAVTYDGTAKTLTVKNQLSAAALFHFVIQW